MTAPFDLDYCSEQRQVVFRRRRLTVLVGACVLALVVYGFSATPDDTHIEGNQRNVEATR